MNNNVFRCSIQREGEEFVIVVGWFAERTYHIQVYDYRPARIDGRFHAAELLDFAEDADCAVGKGFEVWGGDAGGCFGHDGVDGMGFFVKLVGSYLGGVFEMGI